MQDSPTLGTRRTVRRYSLQEAAAAGIEPFTIMMARSTGAVGLEISTYPGADGKAIKRIDPVMPPRGTMVLKRKIVPVAQVRRMTRPTGRISGRAAREATNTRTRRSRRTAASSSSSSADPGDPSPADDDGPRSCACGCGRDISNKRLDARTFGASCRQRLKRQSAASEEPRRPVLAESCHCDSGFFYRDHDGDAVCGSCGCWIGKVSPRLIDYDEFDALMRSNGTSVNRRPIRREWNTRPRRSEVAA